MNSKLLYKEIGMIDDDLILEADTFKKAKYFPIIARRLGLVACFAAVIFSVFLPQLIGENSIFPKRGATNDKVYTNHNTPHKTDDKILIFNKASSSSQNDIYIPGHFWQELSREELSAILPGFSDVNITATANFEGDGTLFNIDIHTKMKSGTDVYIQLAPGDPILDYFFDSKIMESKIDGVDVIAGYFEGNHINIYFANFKLEDVGYYLECRIDTKEKELIEKEKEMFTELIYHIISGGSADFSILNPVIPELKDEILTKDEVYADKDFGGYIPENVPDGFVFESSNRFINQEQNYLSVLWTKGLNEIRWMVSKRSQSSEFRITSVDDKKNYDLSLYPIPRASSVPENLREIVENPIFPIEDLTLDVVKARAYTINDTGDVDGYRMRFSVLYDGNILIEVRSKGVDPEDVFNQLINIKKGS